MTHGQALFVALGALTAALGALTACDHVDPPTSPRATVRLALDDATCVATCADAIQARIFRVGDTFPLGPARIALCGDAIVFEALPAGAQVEIEVDVVAADGEVLWRGRSDAATIPADAELDVTVALEPLVTPELTSAAPDPVVLDPDGVSVLLTGVRFGPAPDGDGGVTLDGAPLDILAWSDDSLTVSLPPTAAGASLQARRCAIASAPLPLRLIDPAGPGHAEVPLAPGCSGRAFVASAVEGGDALVVATRCDDPALGHLQRLRASAGACPLAAAEAWTLGASPRAVAVADAVAWVALDATAAVARVDLPTNTRLTDAPLPAGAAALALVAAAGRVFALVTSPDDASTTLVELAPDAPATAVAGLDANLAFAALATDGERVLATATADGPVGKLIAVPLAAGPVASWSLPDCDAPGALAVGADGWVAIACADPTAPRVVAFNLASTVLADAPLAAGVALDALTFDARGDVLVGLDAARAEARLLQLADGALTSLVTWPAAALGGDAGSEPAATTLLAPFATDDRLLLGVDGGAGLSVWTPYDAAGPCPAEAR